MSDHQTTSIYKFSPEQNRCRDCTFFVTPGPKLMPDKGYCYRHPPTVCHEDQGRPVVDPQDFCGEGRTKGGGL
jgi:hypothetical protein